MALITPRKLACPTGGYAADACPSKPLRAGRGCRRVLERKVFPGAAASRLDRATAFRIAAAMRAARGLFSHTAGRSPRTPAPQQELKFDVVERHFKAALNFVGKLHTAYVEANPRTRRHIIQAIFERFLISDDGGITREPTSALPTSCFRQAARPTRTAWYASTPQP